MPLFIIVSEIYGRKVWKWWKIWHFFELFGPPCRIALAYLDGSIPECAQVCALHIEPHFEALRKIEMVAVLCTNETTPHLCEFLTSPPPTPQGPLDPRAGGGTSADIVPTQIKFGLFLWVVNRDHSSKLLSFSENHFFAFWRQTD